MTKAVFQILFLLFLWIIPCSLGAQTPAQNEEKYQHFRQRLCHELMYFTGDAQVRGSHLPLERRYLAGNKTVAFWADAVWWQGHYVAVLATEYARLQQRGESTTATLHELRLAIDTYNRLDVGAESCFGDTTPQLPNGFYLRDDVAKSDTARFHVQDIQSDYVYYCGKLDSRGNQPSQDQAWGSYLGFALAQKLVDDSVLHQQIADIAYRMIKQMQWTDNKGREHWQIVNPVTGALVQKTGDIQWLQYPHAAIGEKLTGRNLHAGRSDKLGWKNIWNILKQNVLIDKDGHFTWYGVLSMAAVLNDAPGRRDCYQWLLETNEKIVRHRPDLQQTLMFPHLPLVNLVLYGTEGRTLEAKERYEAYLNAAPSSGRVTTDEGGKSIRTAHPWHSLSLFCPWHTTVTGEVNMLDYMLLYNLYELIYHS